MAECKTYSYQTGEGHPLYPLVLAMKADGATNAERDGGYAQIDYSAPWKPAKTEGAGDCFIDEREDTELGLKGWRKYKKQLASYYGKGSLMWDFEGIRYNPRGPQKTSKGELFLDRARSAIMEVQNELAEQRLDPASDGWRQKMAEAMFYFYLFPFRTRWASYDNGQKREVLAGLKRLDALGLKRFKVYLIKNGGCDYYYSTPISLQDNYEPNGITFNAVSAEGASTLFAIFEEAGLKPTFMEITDNMPEVFTCGMPIDIMYGVGVALAGGWRVFNTHDNNPDVKGGLVYPLNLRQAEGTRRAMTGSFDAIISRTPSDEEFERIFSNDGFSSNYLIFSNLITRVAGKNDSQIMEGLGDYIKRHRSEFHPLLGGFLDVVLNSVEKKKPDSAVPHDPFSTFLWLFEHYQEIEGDADRAYALARSLLAVDPKCASAHAVIAKLGRAGLLPISDVEIEDHYAKTMAAIPPRHKSEYTLDVKWGEFYLKRGRIQEAKEKFESAWMGPTADDDDRAMAAYYLAFTDRALAAGWLEKSAEFIVKDMGRLDDAKDAEGWSSWLKEAEEENPEMHSALKADKDLSARLAAIWFRVGQALLRGKKPKEAAIAFTKAKSLCQPSDLMMIDSALHEAYLQSEESGRADKIFEHLFQ